MHISFTVPPDPDRARRQVWAAMRGKFLRLYALGGVLAAVGVGLIVADLEAGYAPLAMGVLVVALPWLLPRAAAKARTGVLAEPATYELTEAEVLARTASLSNAYSWEAVDRVAETNEFWVFMVKGTGAVVLPWTLLPVADADRAREFLTGRGLLKSALPTPIR